MHFRRKRGWELPESQVTPETAYADRRSFLKSAGLAGLGLAAAGAGLARPEWAQTGQAQSGRDIDPALVATIESTRGYPTADDYPARRNDRYTVERDLTDELVAASYNNYYEFTTDKGGVWKLARRFTPWPWSLEVKGHAGNKGRLDLETLCKELGLEERIYRFRCVEAWAMTVPWTGFPLSELIKRLEPTSKARYVRFVSFKRYDQARGQATQDWYEWPYYEGISLDEAMNELAFVATGIYGHPLPNQHGAPLRIVLPWKYGYKSAKGVERIEFVSDRPKTFWNDLAPKEYDFVSNVNPNVPHPRWSQAQERIIGPQYVEPTRIFNGYGDFVGDLYPNEPRG